MLAWLGKTPKSGIARTVPPEWTVNSSVRLAASSCISFTATRVQLVVSWRLCQISFVHACRPSRCVLCCPASITHCSTLLHSTPRVQFPISSICISRYKRVASSPEVGWFCRCMGCTELFGSLCDLLIPEADRRSSGSCASVNKQVRLGKVHAHQNRAQHHEINSQKQDTARASKKGNQEIQQSSIKLAGSSRSGRPRKFRLPQQPLASCLIDGHTLLVSNSLLRCN